MSVTIKILRARAKVLQSDLIAERDSVRWVRSSYSAAISDDLDPVLVSKVFDFLKLVETTLPENKYFIDILRSRITSEYKNHFKIEHLLAAIKYIEDIIDLQQRCELEQSEGKMFASFEDKLKQAS